MFRGSNRQITKTNPHKAQRLGSRWFSPLERVLDWLASSPSSSTVKSPRFRPDLVQLEDRVVPSTITWTNRGINNGTDSDNFTATYGAANAALARAIVDRAIQDWETVITSFNYQAFGGVNQPVGADVYTLNISASNLGGGGRGVTNNVRADAQGRLYSASIGLDDDGGGVGWFFDTTPNDDAEFNTLLNQFSANGPNALNGNDFYRTIVHEMGHAMGILTGAISSGTAKITSFLTPYGVDPVDGVSTLMLFQGASVTASLTTNGGGHIYEGPTVGGNPIHPFDLMNAGRTVGFPPPTRELITDLNARILQDAYGYTVKLPSTINTFYANLNTTTGVLTINGSPGSVDDNILVDNQNGSLRVVVNGTQEIFNGVNVTSINVLAGAGDDSITIAASVALPATIDPGTGNDQVHTGGGTTTVTSVAGDGNDVLDFSNSPVGVNFTVRGGDSIIGSNFNDKVTVDSTAGLITSPIFFDGGAGFNTLVLSQSGGPTQTSDTYTVGPNPGEGSSVITGPGGTQSVTFKNLSPVQDNVPATSVTINGTNADNAINYSQGAGGGIFTGNTGFITVDNQESFEFNNKTNLVINALSGSDTISLHYNNTSNPVGLTGTITVNGADPTGSDTLILNGINGVLDNLRYVPTSVGAGTVVNDSEPQPNVLFTGVEHLTLVIQQADGDGIRFDGTTGNDAIEFYHGTTSDSGTFVGTMDQNNATGVGPFTMTPMTYTGANPLANDTDVNFFNPGGTDSFVFNGTANDDVIGVGTAQAGGTAFTNTRNGILVSNIELFNVSSAVVRSYSGNDTVNINVPAGAAAVTLRIEGGDSDAIGDVINYNAFNNAATTVNLGVGTITAAGANPVTYTGVETLNVNANNGNATIVATAGDDVLDVTPTGTDAVTFKLTSSNPSVGSTPVVNFSAVGATMTADGGLGLNSLTFNGTASSDLINLSRSAGNLTLQRSGTQVVTTTNSFFAWNVNGEEGNDIFTITEPNTINVIEINLQGGTGSNSLNLTTAFGQVYLPAAGNNGTLVGGANVNFFNIDTANVNYVAPATTATIQAGGGANQITLNGTAASTVTAVVDNGTSVTFTGTLTTVAVQAGAGDDMISITPGTFAGVFNVNAGDPTASDTLIVTGTAGQDTVVNTPTGVGAGSITVNGIVTNYTATEHIVYSGLGGNDILTMNGTAVDDAFVVNLANGGSGSHRANLFPTFDYTGATAVTANGGTGGFDVVTVNGTENADTFTSAADVITLAGQGTVTLGANLDRVDVNSLGGDDSVTLSGITLASIISGGDGNDTLIGSPQVDTIYGGFGNDIIIGGGSADIEYGEAGDDRFGDPAVADPAANDPGNDQFFGGDGSDTLTWDAGDGSDVFEGGTGQDVMIFNGSVAAEVFTFNANGTRLQLLRNVGAINMDLADVEQVNLNANGGADSVLVNDLYGTGVQLLNLNLGTDGAFDAVNVQGRTIADNIMVTSPGAGQLLVAGLQYNIGITTTEATDFLTLNGNDGNDQITVAPTAAALMTMTLNGGLGDDILNGNVVAINGNEGNDTLIGGAGNQSMDGGAGDDTFIGNGGTDNVGGGASSSIGDTILAAGTTGADTFSLSLDASGHLLVTINGLTTTYQNFLSGPIVSSGIEQILVQGFAGNDRLTVDSSNGAVPILTNFDGGSNADSLVLTGGVATSDTYQAGPGVSEGTSTIVIGGVSQVVHFNYLEPVFDQVGGPLVVNGTNAANAINYMTGNDTTNASNPNWGQVSVDSYEVINFTNKTTLTINGQAGSDIINLGALSVPTGLTAVNIDGNDPGGNDQLVVNGLFGGAAVNYAPTSNVSGSITVNGFINLPVTNYTGIESVLYVGRSAGDNLTVTSPAGGAEITYLPGATMDSGVVTQLGFVAGMELTPFEFRNVGQFATLTFATSGGTRSSGLNIHGTSSDDQFNVNALGDVQVVKPNFGVPVAPSIRTPGIAVLRLIGESGDDIFNVPGNHAFPNGINVQGGDPSASDVLNFSGSGTSALSLDFAGRTIVQAGFSAVSYTGIEILNASAGGQNLNVSATTGDDVVTVTPTGTNALTVSLTSSNPNNGANPVVNAASVGTFTVDLLGGSDRLVVNGSQASETINVTPTLVTVGALKTVNYLNAEDLQVWGQSGNDTFNVTPSATTTIFVDGGDPIGTSPGDKLIINALGNPLMFEAGPQNDEGGFLVGTLQRISFDHIEAVGPIINAPCVVIKGTNAADDITVIARDSSYDPLADGVQDFTVSVNAGFEMLYIGTSMLYIDGLAGDDNIVLRTPAPNNAVWDTDVWIAGGSPATAPPGDRFVLETPGTQTVNYTPTGFDSGIVNLVNLSSVVTLGTFTNACPPLNYNSSVGGVEVFQYSGEGGNDLFTITGTGNADTITSTPGSGTDEGTLRVNNTLAVSYMNMGLGATLTVDGAGGSDTLVAEATANSDVVNVATGTGAVTINARLALNQTSVENLRLNTGNGDDVINLASGLPYTTILVDAGNPSASDVLNYTASANSATSINLIAGSISQTGPVGPTVTYIGVERVNITSSGATSTLTLLGSVGDDTFNFTPSGVGAGSFTANATGAAVYTSPLFTYTGIGGNITANGGGAGFDTVGLAATNGSDNISAVQASATALAYTLNAFTQNFTLASIEASRIDAGDGDDVIFVSVNDALELAPAGSLRFLVQGGSGNDRLLVNDDGIGDLTNLRQINGQSGSAVVGVLNPITYDSSERVDVVPVNNLTGGTGSDGNGRVKVYHSDPWEYNDTRLFAGLLSRIGQSPTSPNIDTAAITNPNPAGGDEDWYEFRPQQTGTFNIRIIFDKIAVLANGRPGLPGAGDLNLDIYDANGNLIVSGVAVSDGKSATFGATNNPAFPQFNRIFVRVRGATSNSVNTYDMEYLGAGNAQVDLNGPQVTNVQITSAPGYNLFGLKPDNTLQGPTPLVNSLTISFQDLPPRVQGFLYPALDPVTAATPGMYVVKGDRVGIVAISQIIVTNNTPVVVGQVPTATVQLIFAQPLADDHFTLTISDHILDPAGNMLDGESNAAEPNGGPTFPSGDGHAGGKFIGAFTVDSRAELGVFANGSVNLDLNGDYKDNPGVSVGNDGIFTTTPNGAAVFAGQFFAPGQAIVDGFDRLGTYGKEAGKFVFRLDYNNDGDFSDPGETIVQTSLQINGLPIAGNWGPSAFNVWTGALTGSNVGVFDGTTWYLDANGNNIIESAAAGDRVLKGNLRGLPFTGDFDGDGLTDLGVYQSGVFSFDLTTRDPGGLLRGNKNYSFKATFPLATSGTASKLARPVASDFNGDGITDVGLFIPNQTTVAAGQANWYLLNSNGRGWDVTVPNGSTRAFKNNVTGLGADLAVTYGSAKALPVVGNFDPLTKARAMGTVSSSSNTVGASMAKALTDLYFATRVDPITGRPRK